MICKKDNTDCGKTTCHFAGECRYGKETDRSKECPVTTFSCIKECKEGECALNRNPFQEIKEANERHYAQEFINFLCCCGINVSGGRFYKMGNSLGQSLSIEEVIDRYLEHKKNSR